MGKLSVGKIPKYITASSPRGLRRLMLRIQVSIGYGVHWFDISSYTEKNKLTFIAWYYDNAEITSQSVMEDDSIKE